MKDHPVSLRVVCGKNFESLSCCWVSWPWLSVQISSYPNSSWFWVDIGVPYQVSNTGLCLCTMAAERIQMRRIKFFSEAYNFRLEELYDIENLHTRNSKLKFHPEGDVVRAFSSRKIQRPRLSLNPWTLSLEASTLPRNHRCLTYSIGQQPLNSFWSPSNENFFVWFNFSNIYFLLEAEWWVISPSPHEPTRYELRYY